MKEKPEPHRKKQVLIEINYIYFSVFFLILMFISASSIFAKENLSGSRFFFSLYAVGQALLETTVLISLAWVIRRFLGSICFAFFIGATFILGCLHVIDFMIERILDLSVWEALDFVLDESFTNFLYLLDASGVPLWAWGLFFIGLVFLPLAGVYLYKATDALVLKSPYRIRRESLLQVFACIPAALLIWDFSASRVLHPDTYTAFIKSLPWKVTFLQPKTVRINVPHMLKAPPSEAKIAAAIDAAQITINDRPNIYLFIIESFRADTITPEIAPHLHRFQEESFHFTTALSNANASHPSWYSIFHSQLPFHWAEMQKQGWRLGSPSLNLLKKGGYQVRLYSSAQLSYYGMEDLLFGEKQHLLNAYYKFHHKAPIPACKTDEQAVEQLLTDLKNHPELKQNQVFITFLDSTHFDYSWPKENPPKFAPFAKTFSYFQAFQSQKSIEFIKNRYRNAVHYIDSLIGRFLEQMPDSERAIVIVTGDHGEEFFEHGHLFHGSHLTDEQTHVPLFMRFGLHPKQKPVSQEMVSQIDIFPSILDYLTGQVPLFLEGQSIFREKLWPYLVSTRGNASRSPYEFFIHNGKNKLILQFSQRKDIFHSKELQIISVRNCKDRSLLECKKNTMDWILEEFGDGLEHLFPN